MTNTGCLTIGLSDAEIGLQISIDGINCALRLFHNWRLRGHQGAKTEAPHRSQPTGPIEANPAHVFSLLCQHCAWQC